MQFDLKEQAIETKLNTSNAIRIPAALRDKFNWKGGEVVFDTFIDFTEQIICFKPKK